VSRAQTLMKEINKALGGEVLHMASDEKFRVTYTPTGLLPVDILLQGGLPRGRFTLIEGDFSTLKSYIGLNAIKEVQRQGGVAALIDTEHAFEEQWARDIGVDTSSLLVERPSSGELAVDIAEALIRSRDVDLIVFDSIAAALPEDEQGKRLHKEKIQPGRLAHLMSAACRKLTAANDKTAVLWINQLRENIGISFGPNEKGPGGRAMPFYASYIINIKKTTKVTRNIKTYTGDQYQSSKEQIGQMFRAEVMKSKLNKPHRTIWFTWLLTDSAIDLTGFLFAQGVDMGMVSNKGKTWTYGSLRAVGKDNFRKRLSATPETHEALESDVRAAHGLSTPKPPKPQKRLKRLKRHG
jgi:recombination protein RecA